MRKNGTAGQATHDNIMRGMRFACRTTKATYTHSEYVVLIACALQQWSQNAPHCLSSLILPVDSLPISRNQIFTTCFHTLDYYSPQ